VDHSFGGLHIKVPSIAGKKARTTSEGSVLRRPFLHLSGLSSRGGDAAVRGAD
jgi:hypothetical protein